MKILILLLSCLSFGNVLGYAGRACSHSLQCGRGSFCNEGACRKDSCSSDAQCETGEECRPGNVNGRQKSGCFLVTTISTSADYCPGGALVLSTLGSITQCDLTTQCPSTHVCNPIHGVCCTKLPVCPKTRKTMLNFITGKPIICQFKGGRVMPCPESGYCENSTGFCCGNEEITIIKSIDTSGLTTKSEKPWRGEFCQTATGCSGGAACICGGRGGTICKCECSGEFGYTVAADGKTCQRVRRRLKEKCRTDMECSAAFSECSSGGCRCKRGFKRNGDGGCEPIEYKCVNKGTVLMKNEKIITCNLRHTTLRSVFSSLKIKNTTTDDEQFEKLMKGINSDPTTNLTLLNDDISERDSCPSDHYCVPVFDDSSRPGYYQGFCCPSPTEIRPICPVGEAHETSYPPDYGCNNCPGDYYCHRDAVATEKTICCPKPCVSLEDIYHDGQCYSIAYYGDSCHISAQCSYSKSPDRAEEYAELSKLECSKGICSCPAGFSFADGTCKRIMCSIGLRGEPSVDKSGQLIRCGRSSDCSMGHMCDPNTHVCCKGTNRCPKDYVETGQLCTEDNCRGVNEICEWTKNGKTKICCTYDDEYNLLQYPSDNSTTVPVL